MNFAHIWKTAIKWNKPSWVKEVNISEISWLLPNPETTNISKIVKWLFINKPSSYDNSFKSIKVDMLCNWKITENTPDAAIKTVTLVEFNSLSPENKNWQNPVIEWSKSPEFTEKYWNISNLVTEINNEECKRSWIPSEITIKTTLEDDEELKLWENYIELAYKSSNPVIKINIYIWKYLVREIEVNNKKWGSFTWKIFIPASKKKEEYITIEAIDNEYYSSKISKSINIK